MSSQTVLKALGILGLAIAIGICFNLSNPNKIPFIGEDKPVDFSQSDSLMHALQKQDSIQKSADSIKTISLKREDSLKTVNEKKLKDSLTAANRQDSLKKIQDSVKTAKQKLQDSVKTAEEKAKDFAKPLDIRLDFAKALFDKKYKFIDARDESDYTAGHIQGAMNIVYHHIDQYRKILEGLPRDQVYVAYCSSACDVSIDLAYEMAHMGFTKVYIFHGGWDEWKAAGYPSD